MTDFHTSGPIATDIAIQIGSVHLIAGNRSETTVVVNPTDKSKSIDVEWARDTQVDLVDRGRLVVNGPKPGGLLGSMFGRYGSIDVTIELPARSTVDVTNGYGDVRIDGEVAETRVKTGAGDIYVDETTTADLVSGAGQMRLGVARGDARLSSAGDMRIRRIEGNAVIKNLNGKISIDEVTGHLRLKSANGDIAVSRAGSTVVAKTANGNIDVGEVGEGTVTLETSAGGIHVGVGEGTATWVDARTKFGRVHNSLQVAERPEPSERTVEITARTSFGDIAVHRSGGKN